MSTARSLVEATFRDPAGYLYTDGDRILREVHPDYAAAAISWLQSPVVKSWTRQRRIVSTDILSSESGQPALLEHERIFFPTYPWEWSPSQWIDAASLTLSLCEEAIDQGFILKDATPLNILFSDSQPIFIDVLSFEERNPCSPIWIAYAQFVRTFLLPLCAYAYPRLAAFGHAARRDGYEPADLAPFVPILRRWRRPIRSLVTLPLLFEQSTPHSAKSIEVAEDLAAFTLQRLMRSARGLLRSIAPPSLTSRWSSYSVSAPHYSGADHSAKQSFLQNALQRIQPAHVLDIGANSGVYSRIAALAGAQVVAWDTDVQATDLNWRTARETNLPICCLSPISPARHPPSAGEIAKAQAYSIEQEAGSTARWRWASCTIS